MSGLYQQGQAARAVLKEAGQGWAKARPRKGTHAVGGFLWWRIYSMSESPYGCLTQRVFTAPPFSKRTSNNQHEEVVIVPTPPFIPDSSKWNGEREQKGRPHSFLAQSPLSQKPDLWWGEGRFWIRYVIRVETGWISINWKWLKRKRIDPRCLKNLLPNRTKRADRGQLQAVTGEDETFHLHLPKLNLL